MSKTPWTQLWLDYKKVNSKGNEAFVKGVSLEGFEAEHPVVKNALAELAAGVQGMLGLEISVKLPAEAFALFDEEGILRLTAGDVTVYVGGHAPDARSNKLTGTKAEEFKIQIAENKVLA